MEENEKQTIDNILQMYNDAHTLKTTRRAGWKLYGLDKHIRHESIAEHIYGCCMLALSIFSNKKSFQEKLDIEKVFMMLILHETEEIYMGDITPYDKEIKDKKVNGQKSVQKFFENSLYSNHFSDIIKEFESFESEEAKFARRIDKLETDLQAEIYAKHFDLKNMSKKVKNSERIKKLKKQGFRKVPDFFEVPDRKIFDDFFNSILDRCNELKSKN